MGSIGERVPRVDQGHGDEEVRHPHPRYRSHRSPVSLDLIGGRVYTVFRIA